MQGRMPVAGVLPAARARLLATLVGHQPQDARFDGALQRMWGCDSSLPSETGSGRGALDGQTVSNSWPCWRVQLAHAPGAVMKHRRFVFLEETCNVMVLCAASAGGSPYGCAFGKDAPF